MVSFFCFKIPKCLDKASGLVYNVPLTKGDHMKASIFYILSFIVVSVAVYQRITYGLADTLIIVVSIPAMFYIIIETWHFIDLLKNRRGRYNER